MLAELAGLLAELAGLLHHQLLLLSHECRLLLRGHLLHHQLLLHLHLLGGHLHLHLLLAVHAGHEWHTRATRESVERSHIDLADGRMSLHALQDLPLEEALLLLHLLLLKLVGTLHLVLDRVELELGKLHLPFAGLDAFEFHLD